MEVVLWPYLITSLASVAVGAFIVYFLNKHAAQNERDATERRQLQDTVQGLLTEICANLKVVEKVVEKDMVQGILPRLAKDMWNMRKSNIIELPSAIQGDLYEAYCSIDKVNSVVESMHAFGSRESWLPDYWDATYKDEAQEARKPMDKAREELKKWLAEQAIESRGEMTMKSERMSKLKDKLGTHSERIVSGCAIFFIVSGCVLIFCQFALGIGVISLGVAGIGVWIATKSDNRMQAMARLEFHEKVVVVENCRVRVKNNATIADQALAHDIRAALELQKWVKRRKEPHLALENQLWESVNALKEEAKAKNNPDYEGLVNALDAIEREFKKP